MGKEAQQILRETLEKTSNDVIIFFIVMAVILVVFFIPLYGMVIKDRRERREAEGRRSREEAKEQMERERGIIQVITANTEVMASLKTTLERDGKANQASFDRIHTRIDSLSVISTDLMGAMVKSQTVLDKTLQVQEYMQQDVRQILLTVDKDIS